MAAEVLTAFRSFLHTINIIHIPVTLVHINIVRISSGIIIIIIIRIGASHP